VHTLSLQVLFAFEEAIGFMVGPYKDKDGISAAAVFCEMAAEIYAQGATLQGTLAALYNRRAHTWNIDNPTGGLHLAGVCRCACLLQCRRAAALLFSAD